MAMQSHIHELSRRHAQLDQLIESELKRPGPDEHRVAELKKQKLRIKDEIERLAH